MSKELLSKFNQVLRPYFAPLSGSDICDVAALQQYLDRLHQDANIVNFMREANADFDALLKLLEASGDKENLEMACHCYMVRFFANYISEPLSRCVIKNFPAAQFQELAVQSLGVANFDTLPHNITAHCFEPSLIINFVNALFSSRRFRLFELPKSNVFADLQPNDASVSTLASSKIKNYFALAGDPNNIRNVLQNRALHQSARNAGARFNVLKCVLSDVANVKIYYDAEGKAYFNRVPQGSSNRDYFVSHTLATVSNLVHANTIKFDLSQLSLNLLQRADMQKLLRRSSLNLVVDSIFGFQIEAAIETLDFNHLFKDCAAFVALITLMQNIKGKFTHELQWQFQPHTPGICQLVFCAKSESSSIIDSTAEAVSDNKTENTDQATQA